MGFPGRSVGACRTGVPVGVPALALPFPPPVALTDAALAILLELELGPALAAVLGHRELNTVVLAAAIAHGAGVDGWGPERSQVSPGRRPGPGQPQSTSCRKTPGPSKPLLLSVHIPEAGALRGRHCSCPVRGPGFASRPTHRIRRAVVRIWTLWPSLPQDWV